MKKTLGFLLLSGFVLLSSSVYAGANKSYYSYIKYRAIAVGRECGAMSLFLPKNDSRYRQLNVDFTALEWYRAVGWNEAGW